MYPQNHTLGKKEEYEKLLEDTTEHLNRIIGKNKKVLLVGDFNCKEINWGTLESYGREKSWGEKLLTLTMENAMKQWVQESTRYRGDDEPSRLDLVLTKGVELAKEVDSMCPIAKSDHVILEIQIESNMKWRKEEHKRNRRNYRKASIENMKTYFQAVNWETLKVKDIQEKYDFFLEVYNIGTGQHVPMYKDKIQGKKEWFNKTCDTAKRRRDEAWNKLEKNRTKTNKNNYKIARNHYTKIRREEKRNMKRILLINVKKNPNYFIDS